MKEQLKPIETIEHDNCLVAKSIYHRIEDSDGVALHIENLNLSINAGKIIGLIGSSGCGKSTIARILAGLLRPTGGGDIQCGGNGFKQPNAPVALVFQDYQNAVFPWLTVEKNIELGTFGTPPGTKNNLDVAKIASDLGVGEFLHKYPHKLSGGQRQRVQLARAVAQEPSFLLLDEPAASLDRVFKVEFGKFLRKEKIKGMGILLVTHDLNDALFLCDGLYLVRKNKEMKVETKWVGGLGGRFSSEGAALSHPDFSKLYNEVSKWIFAEK